MKPNFALNLSHEGISLLHRAKAGWQPMGNAQLDAPDLKTQLAQLKGAAAALEPGPLATKLVIPASEVLFTELTIKTRGAAARLDDIRSALDGLTPYDVTDLVFDHQGDGEIVNVAVVAKQTLREAEEFATSFGFNPVAFVAASPSYSFDGEAFFGATEAAAQLLPDRQTVERDDGPPVPAVPPAADVAPPIAAAQPSSPAPSEPAKSEPAKSKPTKGASASDQAAAPEGRASKRGIEDGAEKPTHQDKAAKPQPDPSSMLSPVIPEPSAPAKPEAQPAPIAFASRRAAPADDPSAPGEPATQPHSEHSGSGSGSGSAEAAPDLAAPAPAAKGPDVTGFRALDLDDVPEMPAWRQAGANRAAAATSAPPRKPPAPQNAVQSTATHPFAGVSTAGSGVAARLGWKRPAQPVSQDPKGTTGAAAAPANPASARAGKLSLTGDPFPTKSQPVIGGKPKYLGLILTLLLLMAFGVIGLWSSLFSEDVADATSPPADTVASAPVLDADTGPAPTPAPQAESASSGIAAVPEPSLPDAPAVEAAPTPAPPTIDTAALQEAVQTAVEAAVTESDPSAQDASETISASTSDAPDTVLPVAPPPDQVTEAPPSAAEAERRYAATGIWQLDPTPLAQPVQAGPLALGTLSSADPGFVQTSFAPLPGSAPDPAASSERPPLRLKASFNLDPRGLVVATPEGNLSPEGTLVYLGAPEVAPGSRPGTQIPAALPAAPIEAAIEEALQAAPADVAAESAPESDPDALTDETLVALTDPAAELDPAPSEAGQEALAAEPEDSSATTEEATEPERPLTPAEQALRDFRPIPRPGSFDESRNNALTNELSDGAALSASDPTPEEEAAADVAAIALFRPAVRPPSIQDEAASDAPQAGEDNAGTEFAVAASLAPGARPSAVEEAAASAAAATAAARRSNEQNAPAADPPAQVAAAVVPSIPSRASVTRAATQENALRLNKVNLIGVYGSSSDRRALVRLKSGRYVKVEVGDRIDGGRVAAIGETELRYTKGGRNITLQMPKG